MKRLLLLTGLLLSLGASAQDMEISEMFDGYKPRIAVPDFMPYFENLIKPEQKVQIEKVKICVLIDNTAAGFVKLCFIDNVLVSHCATEYIGDTTFTKCKELR